MANSEYEFTPLGGDKGGNPINPDDYEVVDLSPATPKGVETNIGELPEITEQTAIPWQERLGTDFKLLFTSEPWEKARIIHKSFPDRTELFQDTKTNEPIIKLDNKHFVVNKAGMSAQDLNVFVAEAGAFIIPSILSGGASILARFGLGALTYGAAELGRQFGTTIFGGKAEDDAPVDVQKVAATSLLGGTTEALLPPVLKIGGRVLRKLWPGGKAASTKGTNTVITAAASGDGRALQRALRAVKPSTAAAADVDIPLTRGQQTGSRSDLETEAMMRGSTGPYGPGATDVIDAADASQMAAIERGAEALQGRVGAGSGFGESVPTAIGTALQSSIMQRESTDRAAAVAKQEAQKELLKSNPALVPNYVMHGGIDRILQIPGERAIRADMLNMMPDATQVLDRLRRIRRHLRSGKIFEANYAVVNDFSRSLTKRITNVMADPARKEEAALLLEIKSQLTDTVDTAMTRGLIQGDPATISAVKAGNKLWSEYMKRFFPLPKGRFGEVDVAGNNLLKILGGESPEKVVGFFVNVTRGAPRKETGELFKRVQNIFGKESEEIKLIKDAVIYRMFTNATQKGKAEVTRTAIVKNYFDFFNKSKSLADIMFTTQERDSIRKFIGQVSRTVAAEVPINPSGSAHVIARLLRDVGTGGLVGRIAGLAKVPVIANVGGAGYAKTLAYVNRLSSAPWGALAVAGMDKDRDSSAQRAVRATAGAVESLLP